MKAFYIPIFEIDSTRGKGMRKREVSIRITGIVIIAFLSSLDSSKAELWTSNYWKLYLIELVSIALIWNGSMFIIQYCLSKISLFKHPAKLLITQGTLLTILVVSVVLMSYYLGSHLVGYMVRINEVRNSILGAWLITFLISSIYASVGFFIQWKQNLLKTQYFERATLEAKYETLKSQVNPHFVFNSLNTLLSMVECNPAAIKYVESLSDFLRYVLQTREKEAVLLRDELSMAKQYVFIQKGRFGDKLTVSIDIPESYYHCAIPPLVLQMLLENAIKHNVIAKDHILEIHIFVDENKYLVVENKIYLKEDMEVSTGIGLNNIKNRYLFLSGKEVIINQADGVFSVKLPLIEYEL